MPVTTGAPVGFTPQTGTPSHRPSSTRSSLARRRLTPTELGAAVNTTLREAMAAERSLRYHKVIQSYRRLLKLMARDTLPKDTEPPPGYTMLLYEIHYHLGLALQQVSAHLQAAAQYTNAITAVFIPKNGCQAGCSSNSCLMTPLYTRRAFAHARAGDTKSALKDAEKAVVLDSKNPDVYCVRSLVRATRDQESEAIKDLDKALKINPNHLCALVIKGSLAEPLMDDDWYNSKKDVKSPEHIKACGINAECHNYLHVQSFAHPQIVPFYEKFLFSLSVPHTISEIHFTSSRLQYSLGGSRSVSRASRGSVSDSPCSEGRSSSHSSVSVTGGAPPGPQRPWRSGTAADHTETLIARRRHEYGSALRKHVNQPRNAEEFLAVIEKKRLRGAVEEAARRGTPNGGRAGPPTASSPPQGSNRMQVFQTVKVKDVPRMYYRPWLGDKLPVAEVERKQWSNPPFK